MNPITVYQPDVRVTLYKTIGRKTLDGTNPVSQRFMQTNQTLDLTAWLGEAGGFRTSKSIRQPAGGFSITLADQAYVSGGALESTYGLIEPMDFIEIRFDTNSSRTSSWQQYNAQYNSLMAQAHALKAQGDAASAAGNSAAATEFWRQSLGASTNAVQLPKPSGVGNPVHMRGFVSEVQRTETMGQDGRPQRSVTISGQDYGKLWQLLQILYLPEYVIGQDILSSFQLFERYGVGFDTAVTVAGFGAQVIEKIVNPFLASLIPANSTNASNSPSPPNQIIVDPITVAGTSGVTSIQSSQGTIYNILRTYCDVGIWNELYLEDRDDGVHFVLRPNPFLDINGNLIQPTAPTLTPITLLDTDIISLNVGRSDANVANYFWVRSPISDMNTDGVIRQQWGMNASTKDTVVLDTYLNAAVQYYGVRPMMVDSQCGGGNVTTFNTGLPMAQQIVRDTSMVNWLNSRREIMLLQNKDNVLFESGSIRIRANGMIKPGNYVNVVRGSFQASYYVTQVDTDYVPFQGAFQTLTVERGTGFINRIKAAGVSSPYLAELTGAANGA